jgi:hypothetical protein
VTIVAPAPAIAPKEDVPDQIRKLAILRDEGTITAEESRGAQKADPLSRM